MNEIGSWLLMTAASQIAERIRQVLPALKSGSLRIWGSWFGRPYDNRHQIVEASADGDILLVRFDAGERLMVFSPRQARIDAETFRIDAASRVRWEWFAYGRPTTPENLFFQDFTQQQDGAIQAETNADWRGADLQATNSAPAVEIV